MAARGGTAKSKVAIPQLAWKAARPAPIVLVSGPEDVLAERAATMLRDALRADDPSLEVSDLEADGCLATGQLQCGAIHTGLWVIYGPAAPCQGHQQGGEECAQMQGMGRYASR